MGHGQGKIETKAEKERLKWDILQGVLDLWVWSQEGDNRPSDEVNRELVFPPPK